MVMVPKAVVVERVRSKSGPEMATPFNEQVVEVLDLNVLSAV